MEDILDRLNEAQTEAVTTTEGFVRVIAGAGSGKTRALTHRFAYLVNDLGIMPGNILCVTFTNKAANEMRQRIHHLIGDQDTGMINTFHGFCANVLTEESNSIHYPKSFQVLDNSDIDAMLRIIYDERGLTLRDSSFQDARDMFEMRKGLTEPDYYLKLINFSLEEIHDLYLNAVNLQDILFYGYLYQEKKCFGLDYNDLIFITLFLYRTNEEIRLRWQKRLEYIMIDEFQDIDPPQYELMQVLCDYHKNLFIVGDPDQTIYTWRGANVRFLLDFDTQYPECKTIMMMKNYRSTPEILNAVNSMIAHNKRRMEKDLIPTRSSGTLPVYYHAKDQLDEAEWIAKEIIKLRDSGMLLKDICVLYRAHYVTRAIEDVFLKKQIPYHIYSGVQFFERTEIKDAIAYMKMLVYQDDLSFLRTVNSPKRNVGKRRIAFLKEYSEAHGVTLYNALKETIDDDIFKGTQASKYIDLIEKYIQLYPQKEVSELLAELMDKSGYEKDLRLQGGQERLDNLAELKQTIFEFEKTVGEETGLENWLKSAALSTNLDTGSTKDEVKMMTIHTAKGLEFSNVFLVSMNEGVLPSRKTKTIQAMEEERRLAFVAMTRAENRLFLSECEGFTHEGANRYVSRFVLEIPESQLEYTVPLPQELLQESIAFIREKNESLLPEEERMLFHIGDKTNHRIFGEGVIEEIDLKEGVATVKFDRLPTSRRIALKALKPNQS